MPKSKAIIREFSGGVVPSLPPDKLPPNFVFRAFNTAFGQGLGGELMLGRRPGFTRHVNLSSTTSGKDVVGLAEFNYSTPTTAEKKYVIAVSEEGTLWKIETGTGVSITVPTGGADFAGATFTASPYWDFQVGGNILFASNGSDRFKIYFNGTGPTCGPVGVQAPSAPTGNTPPYSAGDMVGTYDFATTFYNDKTGTESSRSPALANIDLDSEKITLTKAGTPQAEVTHWRVYVRAQHLGIDYWRAAEVAIGTSTYEVNLDDTAINNLTILAPDVAENNPPPAKVYGFTWHQSRMFCTDGRTLYYSKVGNGEQWDPDAFEPISTSDNDRIMGLESLNATTLLILKERSAHVLIGDEPQTWIIETVSPSIGSNSKFVASGDGLVAWWSFHGPVVWDRTGEPQLAVLTTDLVENAGWNALGTKTDHNMAVIFHPATRRFLFANQGIGAVTGDRWSVLPYSTQFRVVESSGWDWPDMRCIAVIFDEQVWWGDTNRRVLKMDTAGGGNDNAVDTTGTFLVHPITSVVHEGSDIYSLHFSHATNIQTKVANTSTPYVYIINKDTLRVDRSTYSFQAPSLPDQAIVLDDEFSAALRPGVGSYLVFDAPVVEVWTHRSLADHEKKNFNHLMAEVATEKDVRYFVGAYRSNEESPKLVTHASQGTNLYEYLARLTSTTPSQGTGEIAAGTGATHLRKWLGYNGYQYQLKFVGYWPACEWYLKLLGISWRPRQDDWR